MHTKKIEKEEKEKNSICQFISSKLNGHFTTFLLWFTSTKFNDRKIWFYWTLLLNIIELKLFLKRDGAYITSNLWQIWYNSAGANGVPRSQVCAHLTPRFPPYQHQQNFFGAHVWEGGTFFKTFWSIFSPFQAILRNFSCQTPSPVKNWELTLLSLSNKKKDKIKKKITLT